MRKRLVIALGGTVALVAAATAVAAVFTASGISTTTATLTTASAQGIKSRTCTGGDGKSFTVTDARFTGTADFNNPAADFDGPLTMYVRSTVENGSHLGVVQGSFKVRDDDTRLSGTVVGTLDASGKFSGFLTGTARGNHASVVGTLSGTFAPSTGFASPGALLGAAPTSAAFAVVAGPVCKKIRGQNFEAHGTISALNPGPPATITVTGKGPSTATCTLDASSPSTSGFAVGDKVEMKCENVSNTWTLRKLEKRH